MLVTDREVYENVKELISVGKYNQAYKICKSHHCNDKTLEAKINCAKYILRCISSFSDIETTSFKWITSLKKESYVPLREYKREINLNFMANQINEIRNLFDLQ
ncbi:hypothetical protein KQ51_01363 [Candidatus Izimaplasma bacterium HR1]|jgi:hypothetical protein|uniref:hypothetical protein n=1 Tax=Candidatus Izimoplasma sp. HR1 TaxID=1541959 RepID=UPI0004F77A99|nr:hypothetical protein KQ51_01363 [Candidatus Izimaplasma bacterium HR1]